MQSQKSIVFLGFSDFPYGLAEAQKIILISKSLHIKGNVVTVISRNGTYAKNSFPDLQAQGIYENIHYNYVSGSCHRNESFLKRRWFEQKGKINEFRLLKKMKKENNLDFAILSTRSIYLVAYYRLLSKMLGFKVILNYVEFYTSIKKEKYQIGKRFNDYLFDNYAPALSHMVFPISEFLIKQCQKRSPSKPFLKIPPITDFSRYQNIELLETEKYFLFCGYAGYKEIILFIIDAFELIHDPSYYLYLVINGSESDMQIIENYILKSSKKENIKAFSMLSQDILFTYYKNAKALLIPLRPTFQDIARFPHKTGEYLASGNPVISTNYGEIKNYFSDMKNMLLAETYDVKLFAEKMQFVIDHSEQSKKIGKAGMELASKLFDYRSKAEELDLFLNNHLNGKRHKTLNTSVKIKTENKSQKNNHLQE
jgi:glycosyltransferase involved in cell wall biosynthesis